MNARHRKILAFAVLLSAILFFALTLWQESEAKISEQSRKRATETLISEVTKHKTNISRIIQLIQEGADVNFTNRNHASILELAVSNNKSTDVLQVLIENGANVDIASAHGMTPLMCTASWSSRFDFLRFLIRNGASVNITDTRGETALTRAARENSNPEVLRFLIENGASVDVENSFWKSTPLMSAAEKNPNPEVLRVLIENGANVNVVNKDGRTPLMLALIYNENPDVLRLLIKNGAEVNVADKDRNTPLILAAGYRPPEDLQFLIEMGANVNAVGENGTTPLSRAAAYNLNTEVLRLLIENGADVNAVDNNRSTLLISASHNSNIEVMQILIESGARNVANRNGETPLMRAARFNTNPEVLRLLIENGSKVNDADKEGVTPLMSAAGSPYNLNPDVVRLLIENGAKVNFTNKNGETPLIGAAKRNTNPEVIRLLIENGADVSARDKDGKRAIDYALDNERLKGENAYYLRETMVEGDVNLNLYHPWSESVQPQSHYISPFRTRGKYPKLDSPAALRIKDDYPRLDGATLAYPLYAVVTNEVFEVSDKAELQQYLVCSKTSEAYKRLIDGEADIIFVLEPSDEQLQSAKDAGDELHFTPLAKDAFIFFVNNRNPVSDLSVEQIRDIYLKKIANWQEVGGSDRPILSYQRPENSGSQTAMIKEVMKGVKLPHPNQEWIQIANSMMMVVLEVAQYKEESIGYSFRFFTEEMMRDVWGARKRQVEYFQSMIDLIPANDAELNEKREKYMNELQEVMEQPVKLLAVNGIVPNEENIRNGTYPFTVDIYAVTAGSPNPHVQELIAWMLSPQGQELIERTGYIGVAK